MTMNIILGSTSACKRAALVEACVRLGLTASIDTIRARSEQDLQPMGLDAMMRGARTRALCARSACPGSIAIGIENGIISGDSGNECVFLDLAALVMIAPPSREIMALSPGIEIPEKYVRIARERGFARTTVGSVIAENLGGDPTDPHSVLTKGMISRKEMLVNGLIAAFAQL
jgi:non-canonical (house-cleaning) NTP pyrophosphatase